MARTEVYQLRLAPGEKARLKRLAGDESIAQMIRKTFGLDTEEPDEAGMAAAADPTVALPDPGSDQTTVLTPRSGRTTTATTDEVIEQLTKQFHGQGYTWPVARRMAREELGN